jgi:hypothetical protein
MGNSETKREPISYAKIGYASPSSISLYVDDPMAVWDEQAFILSSSNEVTVNVFFSKALGATLTNIVTLTASPTASPGSEPAV